jgi:hypothetical protein
VWRGLYAPTLILGIATSSFSLLTRSALATVIFSDDFSTSTIPTGTYPTPTSTSTGYAIASSKAQNPAATIGTGHLKFGIASTSSGLEEAQAQFTTSPVALANAGDSIDFILTFTNTGILTSSSTTSGQVMFGLFNSGTVAPKTDLQNAAITTATTDPTGGAQNWQGYVGAIFFTGGSSKILNRSAQTGTDNTNQDLLGNNFSASNSFHNPAGTNLSGSSTTPSVTLTSGNIYTEDLNITLTGAGPNTASITTSLYAGNTVGGVPISTQSVTGVTGGNLLTTSFDSLAFGWRETGSVASLMDANALSVVFTPAPEPASLVMMGLGAGALGLGAYRRRKKVRGT